jgi:LPXTG-site transpeptidase (sortase) family protein
MYTTNGKPQSLRNIFYGKGVHICMKNIRSYYYAFALIFILCGLVFGSWLWSRSSTQSMQGQDTTRSQETGIPAPITSPVWDGGHLIIPSLQINAPIEAVGLLSNGSMGVPTQNPWEHVGWYQYGPVPGEQGSAVIDGHLDRPGGKPAVFWKLGELRIGDSVMITNGQGKKLHFRVTDSRLYTPTNAPRAKIFTDTSGKFLNLITCAGQWVPEQRQKTHRLIVSTVLVSEAPGSISTADQM